MSNFTGDSKNDGSPNVRAPDPMIKDRLIDDPYPYFTGPSYETGAFHNVRSKMAGSTSWSKVKKLADLFDPPVELQHHGNYVSACEQGVIENKWVIVNIQNDDFDAHKLNRDTWKYKLLNDFIKKKFLFWQQYYKTASGRRYTMEYTPKSLPHISILEPSTRMKMIEWSGFVKPTTLFRELRAFIDSNKSPLDPSIINKIQPPPPKISESIRKMSEMTEEEALEAAIRASLSENASLETDPGSSSRASSNISTSKNVSILKDDEEIVYVKDPDDGWNDDNASSYDEYSSEEIEDLNFEQFEKRVLKRKADASRIQEKSGSKKIKSLGDGTIEKPIVVEEKIDLKEKEDNHVVGDKYNISKEEEVEERISLSEEAPHDSSISTKIQIKFSDGKLMRRWFLKEDKVDKIFTFAKYKIQEFYSHQKGKKFSLCTVFPKKVIDNIEATLEDEKLLNTSLNLVFEENRSESEDSDCSDSDY